MNSEPTELASDGTAAAATRPLVIALFWLLVTLPLAWGVYNTLLQALQLLG